MIEITRSNWWVTIRTVFFGAQQENPQVDADLIGCIQCARPNVGFQLVRTLHIDLNRDRDLLFSDLAKSTKNQVNRAAKQDCFRYTAIAQPTEMDILAFRTFYNAFARAKGTTLCRPYHIETLKLLMEQNGLVITRVDDAEGEALCYHVYVADGKRAMLLYSASNFRAIEDRQRRNRLARANRFQHWNDILFFKQAGFSVYDCGGLTEDARVEEFKRSFGGTEVAEYTGYVPLTWRGTMAAGFRRMLSRLRRHIFSPS
ncbi:MAG: hypothetical protein QOK44_3852 [Betaproteobacteria bacterium]|nr:hypothetical protein [Betaproteobacteria bacterium]